MASKDVSVQIVKRNPDGTFTVRMDGENPYGGGTEQQQSGYTAVIDGVSISFASEADFQKAMALVGGGVPMRRGGYGGRGGGGGSAQRFLSAGADAAATVSNLFQIRNLRAQRDNLASALRDSADARDRLAQLQNKFPELVPPLLDYMESEREAMAVSLNIYEDQITSLSIETGANALRTVADVMWDGQSGRWNGGGEENSSFSGLAYAGIGLGIGYLLQNTNNSNRPRNRR